MTAQQSARADTTPAEGHHCGHPVCAPHSDTQPFRVFVPGKPAPQGSKTYLGNGAMRESSKRVKPWRAEIREHVLARHDGTPLDGPIEVSLVFVMPRPKSHYRTGRNKNLLRDSAPARPAGKPDIDKLARAVLDALGSDGLNIWHDDAQVVELHASKHYIFAPDKKPGVLIRLNPLED